MVVWWRSFAFRFVFFYSAAVFLSVVLGMAVLYEREKTEVIGKFGLVLEAIAKTVAPQIDGSLLDDVRSNADATSPPFQIVRSVLSRVMRDNNLKAEQIYILRPNQKGEFEFVVMIQKKTFVGDIYKPPKAVQNAYAVVTKEARAVRTDLYTDDFGSFISGLAPIVRPDGTVAGILHVDYDIELFLDEVDSMLKVYLLGLLGLCIFFVIFGVYIHRQLSSDVLALVKGTRAIENEDYNHVIKVKRSDELSMVANALNRAISGLGERFEMLKYLPKHTAAMIREAMSKGGVNRADGARVETAVFSSDIRGFTRLSEAWPAEKVVRMLNEFICVQAEIITKYGGSIDKYMGDAVLAVFEGDKKELRAVKSAVEIQAAIESMNQQDIVEEPILIGIGITVGELVMGNMGSDERMEYTVIGSPVNLSARLCSKADGKVTIISDRVFESIKQDEVSIPFTKELHLSVKGFEEAVKCYSMTT